MYKLFQKHKEISRIIRNDVKLNECLASALKNSGAHLEDSSAELKRKSEEVTSAAISKGKKEIKENLNVKKSSKKCGKNLDVSNLSGNPPYPPDVTTKGQGQYSKTKRNGSCYKADKLRSIDCETLEIRKKETDLLMNSSHGNRVEETNFSVSLNGTQEVYYDVENSMEISHTQTQSNVDNVKNNKTQNHEEILKQLGLHTSTQVAPKSITGDFIIRDIATTEKGIAQNDSKEDCSIGKETNPILTDIDMKNTGQQRTNINDCFTNASNRKSLELKSPKNSGVESNMKKTGVERDVLNQNQSPFSNSTDVSRRPVQISCDVPSSAPVNFLQPTTSSVATSCLPGALQNTSLAYLSLPMKIALYKFQV